MRELTPRQANFYVRVVAAYKSGGEEPVRLGNLGPTTETIGLVQELEKKGWVSASYGGQVRGGRFEQGHSWADTLVEPLFVGEVEDGLEVI